MRIFKTLLIFSISQIISEVIEEVLQQPKQDIPHHPGLSSSSRKNNKQPYDEQYQQYQSKRDHLDDISHSDTEGTRSSINPRINHSPQHPGKGHEQMRRNDHIGNPVRMNNEYSGDTINDNNARIGNPMRMNDEYMGDPQRTNNVHMGGPMGMHNNYIGGHTGIRSGVQDHHNMGQFNHHGDHHIHQNNQPHQNQYSSNMNTNSHSSWFSGTFGTLYEIMMILFLVGLVYNCIFGRNTNDKYAMNWYNANRQYFEERYEHIGLNKAEMEELPQNTVMKDSVIVKESPYFFKLYCSNYRYIKWSLTALEFKKRFDASAILTSFFFSDTDKLVYEIAFKPTDPLGWVFCVCKKRDEKAIKKSYPDLAFFTHDYEPSVMNERMCLLSENLEYFMELFQNKNLFPYYKQIEQFLDVIYFTDQASFCNEQYAVFFSFDINLTYSRQERRFLEITHFVNLFVDTLAQLKYKPKFKDEVQKNRINYERSKMEESQRKEIEEKEKNDFIEKWKIKNKMKYKKGAERKKLEKELAKYN